RARPRIAGLQLVELKRGARGRELADELNLVAPQHGAGADEELEPHLNEAIAELERHLGDGERGRVCLAVDIDLTGAIATVADRSARQPRWLPGGEDGLTRLRIEPECIEWQHGCRRIRVGARERVLRDARTVAITQATIGAQRISGKVIGLTR